MKHQAEDYLASGMTSHVAKPLEFELLLDAMARALEASRSGHEGVAMAGRAAS